MTSLKILQLIVATTILTIWLLNFLAGISTKKKKYVEPDDPSIITKDVKKINLN